MFASPFFPKFSVFVLKIDVVNNNKVCTGTFYNKVCTMYNTMYRYLFGIIGHDCIIAAPENYHDNFMSVQEIQ